MGRGRSTTKTRLLGLIKDFQWKELEEALAESPELVDYRDDRGRNWLHLCCSVNPRQRRLSAARGVRTADVLLSAGLDIDAEAFREGDWKATPLWYAVARGENLALSRHLLQRGSDPNHCLWAAAFKDELAAIKLLIRHGADVDPVTEDTTPFLGAVRWSRFRSARLLLESGADVDFQDSRGMTALHYMLKKGSDARHFRMLIEHGARGDLENRDGSSAAEIMRRKRAPGFRELAERLLAG